MHRALFNSWKFALLWAIGISASVAAFFADGGGHEELAASAEQIREKRGGSNRAKPVVAEPMPDPAPAASPVAEAEPDEPAFGEPMDGSGVDDQGEAAAAKKAPAGEGEEEL